MFKQTSKQQTARTTSIPAPIKGLNARDGIAEMDPTYALSLDNYTCQVTTVDTRDGTNNWATGLGSWVETIAHYSGGATQTMFAAAGAHVYNVTTGGAVGSAVISGLTSARFQTTNFATPGGTFLYMVNGSDAPELWDGSTWHAITTVSTPYAITGSYNSVALAPANLIHVNGFQNRLYFIEKNTMHVWYLPIQSISGTAQCFDLSSQFTRGGYLMAMMTWTIDNTSGVQDYAVFITSEGEVAIYSGYDPSFASSFTLVGKFYMGRPIGRRCFTKMGSDNVVICDDGVVMMSKELTTDRDLSSALSYTIEKLVNLDINSYNGNFGWQPVYYPLGNVLIINVPVNENLIQYQYVMNTISGAWSTWNKVSSGFNAACWDVFENQIYFGGHGVVVQAMTGENDNGSAIISDMKPAFSYFGALGQEKYFTMVRPIIASDGAIMPSYVLCLDYADSLPTAPSLSQGYSSPWDTSPWDITSWGGSPIINKNWITVGGIGYAASLRMQLQTLNVQASLQSIDYVYEVGGVL